MKHCVKKLILWVKRYKDIMKTFYRKVRKSAFESLFVLHHGHGYPESHIS